MPLLRTLLAVPVVLILVGFAPYSARSRIRPSDTVLSQMVLLGGVPAAASLVLDGTASRYTAAGAGISRADHLRGGGVTKTFVATVVLQLAAEERLSLSDTVERHLPGLYGEPATTGAR